MTTVANTTRFRPQMVTSWMWLRRCRWWLVAWLAGWLLRLFGPRDATAIGILMYHRVADVPDSGPPPTWNVTPAQLRQQLSGLLAAGFQFWPLQRVLQFRRDNLPIPPHTLVVTFDDGFENNYLHALPILQELKIPATIFLATSYLDSDAPFPFDDWQLAGSPNVPETAWRPLRTEQCRELLASGWIEFGSHTHTHENFRGQAAAFRDDLATSLEYLRSEFQITQPPFAYPFGTVDAGLRTACQELELECCLTTEPKSNDPTSAPNDWGRLDIKPEFSARDIAIRLDGWHAVVEQAWKTLLAALRSPRSTLHRLATAASVIAVVDQAVLSAGNFATGVLLGKSSPTELAIYYFAFRILWMFRVLQYQTITFPLKVFSQRFSGEALAKYFGSTLVQQGLLASISAVALLLLFAIEKLHLGFNGMGPTFAVLVAVLPIALCREFVRQSTFARFRPDRALLVDFIAVLVQVGGLWVAHRQGLVTAPLAFILLGLASGVACLEWLCPGRPQWRVGRSELFADWKKNWNFGKWGLATDLISNLMILSLTWLVEFFHNLNEVGRLAAAVIPVGIATMFIQGSINVFMPHASRVFLQQGVNGLSRLLLKLWLAFAFVLGSLTLIMALFGEPILQLLYSDKFAGCATIAVMCLVSSLVSSVGFVASSGMYLVERAQSVLWTELLQFALAMLAAIYFVPHWGAIGVPIATTICALVGGVVRLLVYLAWRREQLQTEEASP